MTLTFNQWAADQDITKIGGYERFLVVESDKYIPYVPEQLVPQSMFMPREDAQFVAQAAVEIENYVNQSMVAFITGRRDLDTAWDSYVDGFAGLNLDTYLSLLQETYDDTWAKFVRAVPGN